jgi:hypothetical protein
MIIGKPLFSSPKRWSTGTRTSSSSINVEPSIKSAKLRLNTGEEYIPLALTPELYIRRHVTPGAFKGITSKLIPALPGPPVLTAAVQKSAQRPLVIHFFAPLTT